MKKAFAILVIAASGMAFAQGSKEEHKAKMAEHKAAINSACTADAEKAGCTGKEVGTGLMKCLHAYKKANKGFEISESCKEATKSAHADRKEWKAKKAAAGVEKNSEEKSNK